MTLNTIIKYPCIKENQLDKNNYTQSLLKQLLDNNIISVNKIENIQLELIEILSKQVEKYTRKESSSVKIDVAQNITLSIFYNIDFYLKNLCNIDMCIDILKTQSLKKIYEDSINFIKIKIDDTKQLYENVKGNKLDIDIIAYIETIKDISDFFINYNIDFYSHDTNVTIDYPLAIDIMDLRGIEYIYNYLNNLYYENEFCNNFAIGDIKALLNNYSIIYKFKYCDMLINIFEVILTNSLASMLLKRNPRQLNISYNDCNQIRNIVFNLNQNEYKNIIKEIFDVIVEEFKIEDYFKPYLKDIIINISKKIKMYIKWNKLNTLFASQKEKPLTQSFHFKDRESIDDEKFRSITEKIRNSNNISDKLNIISNNVLSFKDLIDIFDSYCIFDEEYTYVFKSLRDMELAMLLKFTGFNKKSGIYIEDLKLTEQGKQWRIYFDKYLKSIDKNKLNEIWELSGKII